MAKQSNHLKHSCEKTSVKGWKIGCTPNNSVNEWTSKRTKCKSNSTVTLHSNNELFPPGEHVNNYELLLLVSRGDHNKYHKL